MKVIKKTVCLCIVTITTSSPNPNGVNKIIDPFKKVIGYILLHILKYIPGAQEESSKEVRRKPHSLAFVPDHFKTQEMCNEMDEADPYMSKFVPVHIRTYEMSFNAA